MATAALSLYLPLAPYEFIGVLRLLHKSIWPKLKGVSYTFFHVSRDGRQISSSRLFDLLDQGRDNFEQIPDQTHVGHLKDRGLWIFVDGHDDI
jgi:hypothetical protein